MHYIYILYVKDSDKNHAYVCQCFFPNIFIVTVLNGGFARRKLPFDFAFSSHVGYFAKCTYRVLLFLPYVINCV